MMIPIAMWLALCGCGGRHVRIYEGVTVSDPVPLTAGADLPPAVGPERSAVARQADAGLVDAGGGTATERPASRSMNAVIEELNGELQDAFFDYDRSALMTDGLAALEQDAVLLRPVLAGFPQVKITVEGHCDERGSAEYNLALGDDRARRAGEALRRLGVPAMNLEIISYGKERPQCTEPGESCWRRNRRAHLVVRGPGVTE